MFNCFHYINTIIYSIISIPIICLRLLIESTQRSDEFSNLQPYIELYIQPRTCQVGQYTNNNIICDAILAQQLLKLDRQVRLSSVLLTQFQYFYFIMDKTVKA